MQIEKLAKLFEGLGWDVERKRAGCAPGREREEWDRKARSTKLENACITNMNMWNL